MDDRRRRLGRQVLRQPIDQAVHRRDRLGLGGAVLPAPTRDLAAHVIAGPTKIAETDGFVIDDVQCGDDRVHRVEHRRPLARRHPGQPLVPEDAAVEMLHHIEGAADHAVVLAQRIDLRHRHLAAAQRPHHPELAVDRMRAR